MTPHFSSIKNVTVMDAKRWDMAPSWGGAPYRIMLSVPDTPPPPTGFPVIYTLDGNATFSTMVDAMRTQSFIQGSERVDKAIIVGIGYPTEAPFDMTRRAIDYTPPSPTGWKNALELTRRNWHFGGADRFYDFLERDLMPRIARNYPVDEHRQAIFGHSLGGIFVLYTLFTHPEAFNTYVAASPAIWWNDGVILHYERYLSERITRSGLPNIRLLLTVGEYEQALSPGERQRDDASVVAARRRSHKMIDNTRELGQRLKALDPQALDVKFSLFDEETHSSVLPAAISRGMRFALEHDERRTENDGDEP
ncbi:alpha/beta hydrolase [Phytohalomonas tamaricis]|uniref:alpha/beta hydrolase n=1 Tax=Phytohalomonas tamaricis TaxID=2081032 RepID=UPI00131A138D|nr:alpha/beta hydrolase-fold protein [Phytohalomonas tamaricis]